MDGPENGSFSLLYVVKMSLRGWVVQKSLKTPLHNIKMAPYMPMLLSDLDLTPLSLNNLGYLLSLKY